MKVSSVLSNCVLEMFPSLSWTRADTQEGGTCLMTQSKHNEKLIGTTTQWGLGPRQCCTQEDAWPWLQTILVISAGGLLPTFHKQKSGM